MPLRSRLNEAADTLLPIPVGYTNGTSFFNSMTGDGIEEVSI
jgi:hypothetical protein